MSLKQGEIEFVILEDGTVRTTTGDMSGPSHDMVDKLLKSLDQLLGGTVEIEKSKAKHEHHHHVVQNQQKLEQK